MSDGMKRRDFLKVLGVTGAGAATVGCSTGKVEKLIPYVIPPEDIVPGTSTYYTSTCRECPAGCGILVETHEGRATKVEGNPANPISHGNTCARGQASVQGLYHPDRYRGPSLAEETGIPARNVSWAYAEGALAQRIREIQAAGQGGSIVFLTGGYRGTMSTLADAFTGAIGARRVDYAPLEDTPRDVDFKDADLLVAFGADFLETWGSPVDYAWQFAQMHGYRDGKRGRFVWVGPHRPLTGLNADLWVPAKPGTEVVVAQALAGQVAVAQAAQVAGLSDAEAKRLQTAVDWWKAAGRKVALGPGYAVAGRGSAAVQAAVDALNGRPTAPARADLRPVAQLVADMNAGRVQMILIDADNPAYALPGGLGFAQAMQKVPVRVSFSSFPDETSALCNYVLPKHHFLESWDDYVPRPGVFELVQPAMRPVFNTKQVGDVLLSVAAHMSLPAVGGGVSTYYDYLVRAWAGLATGSAWRDAVKRGGVYNGPAGGAAAMAVAAAAPAGGGLPAPSEGSGDLHLVVYPSYRFFDGRNANRPWLMELPDPVAKVAWDSFLEVHPETARRLSVRQGDYVQVKSPYGSVTVAVYEYPGVRRDTVALQMGLGHKEFGRYTKDRGVNAFALLGPTAIDPATGAFSPYGLKVSVTPTGESGEVYKEGLFTVPQGIYETGVRLQHDREIAQAVGFDQIRALDARGPGEIPGQGEVLEELKGAGGFRPEAMRTDPGHYPPPGTEYGEYIEHSTRWAMAVDLSRCIGCSACTVACSAENNVPVVGPSELKKGRELFWLRIERYFGVGQETEAAYRDDATDDVRFLPMLCQHCGQAPCEPVCPVYAAYHTPEGTNGQVYNRCVGTRYCANNCPYKVRVFNWFTYEFAEPLTWQLNPDVTVREKGVMEKCTFCIQRIHEAERNAAVEGREIRDGEVTTACAQVCPTEVFVFGNINDPQSAVAKAATSNRGYRALGELNTQPAIVYLKKVTLGEPLNSEREQEKPAPFGGNEHQPQGGI
jgi:anaerobic selenocysteine-containing dehydrogenase/Fe-S-cluster-containing dehydrogenase component